MDRATEEYYQNKPHARYLALAAISLGTAQAVLTLSAVQVAVPVLATQLNATAIQVAWIPLSFLLVNAVSILAAGRIADLHGRKRVYLAGTVLFAISNLLAAQASNIDSLLLYRALQGLATSMLHASGMAIIAGIFSDKHRAMALGIATAAIYFGLSLGPVLGGFATEYFGWRSTFLIQVPVSILCMALLLKVLKGEWRAEQAMPVDWAGTSLLGLALVPICVGLSIVSLPGYLTTSIFTMCLGLLCAVAFVWQQKRAASPLLRFAIIAENKPFMNSIRTAFFLYAGNYTMVFLMSLLLQFLLGLSPAQAGTLIVAQSLTIALCNLLSANLSSWVPERVLISVGCALVSCGFLILCTMSQPYPQHLIVLALVFNGIGMGLFTTPNNHAALSSVSVERLSSASAILNLARYLGNLLGTALVLTVMATVVGQETIQESNLGALSVAVKWSFSFALLCAIIATFSSARYALKTAGGAKSA